MLHTPKIDTSNKQILFLYVIFLAGRSRNDTQNSSDIIIDNEIKFNFELVSRRFRLFNNLKARVGVVVPR